MENSYEYDFMEAQKSIISLCLELTDQKVDQIYAYGSIEEKSLSFNAFFTKDGNIITINKLPIDTNLMWNFLDLGAEDLRKLRVVCENHKKVVPTEIKLVYNLSTGGLDAAYKYETVASPKTGKKFRYYICRMDWWN